MKKENKSGYKFIWSNYQAIYSIEANLESLAKFPQMAWNRLENIIHISRKNTIYTYHSINDLKNDAIRGRLFFNKKFREKLFKDSEQEINKCKKLYERIKKQDLKNIDDEKCLELLSKIYNQYSRVIAYFRVTQAEGTRLLIKKIKKFVTDEEMSTLIIPPQMDPISKELKDWQKILKMHFKKSIIMNYCYKYPWIVAAHFSTSEIMDTLKHKYLYEKKHLKFRDTRKEKALLRVKQKKIIGIKPGVKDLAKLAQNLALMRLKIKSCWAGSDFYLIFLFSEISKRTGENISDIFKYYLFNEIVALLKKKKKLTVMEKLKRDACFVGLWKNNKIRFFSGKDGEQTAKKELGELYKIKKFKKVLGTAANKGYLKNQAYVLMSNDSEAARIARKEFKKGEVLITQMTQPNIMDIASRAGAIVTDEGGLLSHAAIISRELNIPCVVGTNFATSIIKTGNLIEVDADNGIIKILNK
jgi:phosphohistidine swiveling domain-containing protein